MPETHAVHVYDVKATISLLLDRFLNHELERIEITVAWPKEKNLSVDLGIQVFEENGASVFDVRGKQRRCNW
jgi:hypothetical protein